MSYPWVLKNTRARSRANLLLFFILRKYNGNDKKTPHGLYNHNTYHRKNMLNKIWKELLLGGVAV